MTTKTAKKINLKSILNGGISNHVVVYAANKISDHAFQQSTFVGDTAASGLGLTVANSPMLLGAAEKKDFFLPQTIDLGGGTITYGGAGYDKVPQEDPFIVAFNFSQELPVIVLTTEFLPIYGNSITASDRDFALKIKEQSALLTAKNATIILTKNNSINSLIEQNRKNNIDLIKKLGNKAFTLLQVLSIAEGALDIKNYSHIPKNKKISTSNQTISSESQGSSQFTLVSDDQKKKVTSNISVSAAFKSFVKYTEDFGIPKGDAERMSPTALYQQFLIELKRSLLTWPALSAGAASSTQKYMLTGRFDFDPITLTFTGIGPIPPATNDTFFKPYDIYNKFFAAPTKDKYKSPYAFGLSLRTLLSRKHKDILKDINSEKPISIIGDPTLRHFIFDELTVGKGNNDCKGIYSFIKEVNYSKALNSEKIQSVLSEFFTINKTSSGGVFTNKFSNANVWNSLICDNFEHSANVLESGADTKTKNLDTNAPNKQGKNLTNLSRTNNVVSNLKVQKTYAVLTFESEVIPETDNAAKNDMIPGRFFYIDSSLFTTDFEKFDARRVDLLLNDLNQAKTNLSLIKSIFTGRTSISNKDVHQLVDAANNDDPYLTAIKKLDPWLMGAYRTILSIGTNGKLAVENVEKRKILYRLDEGLQQQGVTILLATIFKTAFKKKDVKLLRLLFQVVMREAYKKLYSDFSVDYENFESRLSEPYERLTNIEMDTDFNEGSITDDEADFITQSFSEPSFQDATGATSDFLSWDTFLKFANQLIDLNGNAHTPELMIDGILLNTHIFEKYAPGKLNLSVAKPNYLPLGACANIGKNTILPGYEGPEGDIYKAVLQNGGVDLQIDMLGSVAAYGAEALGWDTEMSLSNSGKAGGFALGEDRVSLADNFIIHSMFKKGKSLIENLGTGLNGETYGLFKEIVGLIIEFFKLEIYKTDIPTPQQLATLLASPMSERGTTYHLSIPKPIMVWKYFLCICDIISQMTPDKFSGFFSLEGPETNLGGYALQDMTNEIINNYFSVTPEGIISKNTKCIFAKTTDDVVKNYKNLQTDQANRIDILDKFINDAHTKIQNFKNQLTKDFTPYIEETKNILANNDKLSSEQKLSLANLSFTPDQLILSTYELSELSDRIDVNNSAKTEAKLKSELPAFIDFPKGFIDYYPINDFNTISYMPLSKFFDYDKVGGGNRRIISVGLPPTMMRNLLGLSFSPATGLLAASDFKKSILQINVYKNDILHPGIIFKPQTFLFETRRFPTRVISNWQNVKLRDFAHDDIPSKYFNGKEFVLHKNFAAAKNYIMNALGGNLEGFTPSLPEELYRNFTKSFALEQYIKWFSRFGIEETKYHNYSGLNAEIDNLTDQFSNYVASTGGKLNLTNIINASKASASAASSNSSTDAFSFETSIKSYLRNETLLMSPSLIKERVLYSKKFDRVFNIFFDPDAFVIDSLNGSFVDRYVKEGVIEPEKYSYTWSRQTQESDITFDEYWVSVEPFYNS